MSLIGSKIGQLRIAESIGSGGMGEVYAAFDETLKRKVALKAIRPERRLSRTSKARFLREARVLSRLDHPNICRIHNYIEEPDGDFIVLELIQGQELNQAIAGGLDSTLRMSIAGKIVGALVAAHEAGVVHRDLKPQNVMLTPEGSVKVLDFGIARPIDDMSAPEEGAASFAELTPSDETQDGFDSQDTIAVDPYSESSLQTAHGLILGTLAYMSPEQARGEPVTAASDMYSFGLLLQELFTGRTPYEPGLTRSALLQRARKGETQGVTGLDKDLTSLINRLKSLSPSARPTAVETASRLRWIHEEPRRRLRNAAIGIFALLVVLAGLKYTLDLRRERTIAVQARADAEKRRGQAEDLISFMLGDLRERLAPVGRLDVLDAVGDKALDYFDSLSEEELTNEELFRRAKALAQIGDVRMAQGNLAAAMTAFRESVVLADALVRRDSTNTAWLAGLGESRFWIGSVHWERGAVDSTLREFRAYLDIAIRLTALEPQEKAWRLELAYAHNNIGAVLHNQGDNARATVQFQAVVATMRDLVDLEPDNSTWRVMLAEGLSWLASATEASGDLGGALENFQEELRIRQALAAQQPGNSAWQERLSTSHNHIGLIQLDIGMAESALENFDNDLRIAKSLSALDPSNMEWRRALAVSHHHLGRAQLAANRYDEGLDHLHVTAEIMDDLLSLDPSNADWIRVQADTRNEIGREWLRRNEPERTTQEANLALTTLDPLTQKSEGNRHALRILAETRILRGQVLIRSGQAPQAHEEWLMALEHLEESVGETNDRRFLDPLARVLIYLDRPDDARTVVNTLLDQGYRPERFLSLAQRLAP